MWCRDRSFAIKQCLVESTERLEEAWRPTKLQLAFAWEEGVAFEKGKGESGVYDTGGR